MKQPWDLFGPSIIQYLHQDGVSPVFVLNPADRIEYCNRAFQSLLPSEEPPLGRSVGDLFGAESTAVFKVTADTQLHHKKFWHVKTSRGVARFECHIYYAGELRLVVAEKPVITGEDIIAKMGSLNLEVTHMARGLYKKNEAAEASNRKLHAELDKTMAQAERLNALAAMAVGVAHEIAQPLTSIKGIADCAVFWHREGQSVLPDNVISDMEVIAQQSERIDKIIRHMRALVHKQRMEMSACDFNAVVDYVLCQVRTSASDIDVALNSTLDKELPPVLGNTVGIAEVVLNLAANAIKALGKVNVPGKAIAVRTTRAGDHAVLEISDNGPGIDEAIQGKIFEPFITTDPTDSGMGLGLSIVQAIVTAHNGHIDVSPNHPRGTIFRVTFPLAEVTITSD